MKSQDIVRCYVQELTDMFEENLVVTYHVDKLAIFAFEVGVVNMRVLIWQVCYLQRVCE